MAMHVTESRAERAATNEALFREVNERVEEINGATGARTPLRDFLCECPNLHCTERIALTPAEYETLRARPDRFAVAPGNAHLLAEVERVVERHERYWVVEKVGRAGARARELDARS